MDILNGSLQNTVDILGLGESLALHSGNNPTFGVNDIFRVKPVDHLVCVDFKSAFSPERLKIIESSLTCQFYSHLDEWRTMPNFNKILLHQFDNGANMANLDSEKISKSCFSPYVAIGLAWRIYKPEGIRIFGVDMVSHPHLGNQTEKIKRHWAEMKKALNNKGCKVEVFGNGLLSTK